MHKSIAPRITLPTLESRLDTASDFRTPTEVLTNLSEDENAEVRSRVAGNLNTPVDTMTEKSR